MNSRFFLRTFSEDKVKEKIETLIHHTNQKNFIKKFK